MATLYGAIDYERLKQYIRVGMQELVNANLHVFMQSPTSFIPKDMPYEIVVPNGTPDGVEFELEVSPPTGYLLDIYRLSITPAPELLHNVRAVGLDGRETWLFPEDIDGDIVTSEQVFTSVDIWGRLLVKKITFWVKTKTTTTADRAPVFKISGGLVSLVYTG